MTLEETERILQVLRINYPMSYKNMTQEDTQAYLKLWQVSFKDYEYLVVAKAVNQIIQSDTREFAPNVAQVKTRISKTAIGKTKEAGEAWEIVLRNAKCDPHTSKVNYDKLPRNIQKALGGSYLLRDIAWSNKKDLQYYRDRFLQAYKDICEEEVQLLNSGQISLETYQQHDQLPAPKKNEEGMKMLGDLMKG